MGLFYFVGLAYCITLISGSEVCHPPYGCFDEDEPFDRALVQLPRKPEEINVKFIMHTRNSWFSQWKVARYLDPLDPRTVRRIKFDGTRKTVVYAHGYFESVRVWYYPMLMDALLKREDLNVIFVDWERGATFPYFQATGDTRLVGRMIAYLVDMIHNETGLEYSNMHLIGFSLGAHVVGYAGQDTQRRGNKIGRITALDPAGPYYEYHHPLVRLDPTDATFVDVIHTDSKSILIKGFGSEQAMGHADYYPNGGYHQPGCHLVDKAPDQYVACSHYRAVRYFMETCNSPDGSFHAYPCKQYKDFKAGLCTNCSASGCQVAGYDSVPTGGKILSRQYFHTGEEFPYFRYHYMITFKTGTKLLGGFRGGVKVVLEGENGASTITLESSRYAEGSTERRLALAKDDIGEIKSVKVADQAWIDVWYLEYVHIKQLWTQEEYTGCYYQWLNASNNKVDVNKGIVDCKKPEQ